MPGEEQNPEIPGEIEDDQEQPIIDNPPQN